MERVLLMNNQEGDDLIVSFAIEDTEPEETKSLILLRTPKYESVFEDHERGVSVSYDEQPDSEADEDLLIRISRSKHGYCRLQNITGTNSTSRAWTEKNWLTHARF